MSTEQGLHALDRAELELNRILEQIGRVFAATKSGNRSSTLAMATRLKQVLPLSAHNYHNALDELDHQLQMANAILRRDLAVLRGGSTEMGKPSLQATAPLGDDLLIKSEEDKTDQELSSNGQVTIGTTDDTNQEGVNEVETADTIVEKSAVEDNASGEAADTEMADAPDLQQPLKLATTEGVGPDVGTGTDAADNPPLTAFSANADMDSLFNDPIVAGTDEGGSGDTDAIDFGDGANDAADFNFDVFDTTIQPVDQDGEQPDFGLSFTGDNNNSATEEPDFSALFGDVGQQHGEVMPDTEQNIFNFDQLLDIGLDTNAGDGENNNQENMLQADNA